MQSIPPESPSSMEHSRTHTDGSATGIPNAGGWPTVIRADDPPFSRGNLLLMWAHVVLVAAFVLLFRYLPLQDYPEWVYHGVALNQMVGGGGLQGAYELHAYVPPNVVSTVLIAVFNIAFPPEFSGKVFLVLMTTLLYFGAVRFMRLTVRGHDTLLAWASFFFVFNYTFWLGNLSYYFGLGLALYGAHLLLRRGWAGWIWKACLLITAAYLCHFFSWFFILFIAAAAVLLERNRAHLRRLALASLPSLLLFAHYMLVGEKVEGPASAPYPLQELIVRKLQMFAGAILPFQRFKGVAEPEWWMGAANYLMVAVIGVLALVALWRLLRVRRFDLNSLLAVPLPVLILLLPLLAVGIVYPGQRLVVFFVINILAYVVVAYPRLARGLAAFFAVAGIAAFIYAVYFTARFDAMAQAREEPTGESYLSSASKGGTDGFIRLPYYDAMIKQAPMPIFSTGLLKEKKKEE